MISTTAEYALRAAAYLAREPDRPRTTREIARSTRVPPGYLSKVLRLMVKNRVILSVRGVHGGYRLARPPSELTVLSVVNSVDAIPRIEECPLGLPEHRGGLCALHRHLDRATGEIERIFGETTLLQILEENERAPGCAFPDPLEPAG